MKKNQIFLLLLLLFVGSGISQQLSPFVISSSGGFYNNTTGMLSFTVAEMTSVETFTSPGAILTQGFQQVWDFGTDVREQGDPGFSFGVHPNPSDGIFRLVSESTLNEHVSVRILDVLGREIHQSSFNHQGNIHVQHFDISCAAQGIYFIAMTVEEMNSSGSPRRIVKKIKIVR